jgi:hypothetical protein
MMRKFVFYGVMICLVLGTGELVAALTAALLPDLYDQRELTLARIEPAQLTRFASTAASLSLGWDNPANTRVVAANCLGEDKTYTFSSDRTRTDGGAPRSQAEVLIAGDSYTLGDEAADDETFPARLEHALGIPVANLGVNAYGPDQSLLKAAQLIDRYPKARIIVLAIMYEDLARLLNSYRPVYFESNPYAFKPFMRGAHWQPLVAADPWQSVDAARRAANAAFDDDYWRKPRARFPYLVSFAEALAAPAFRHMLVQRNALRFLGVPQYEPIFRSHDVRRSLAAVIDRLAALAREHDLQPVVAFIPRSGADSQSGAEITAEARVTHSGAITFINVDQGIDWSRYNLRPAGGCHPSAYGYAMIARNIFPAIENLLIAR